MNSPYLDDSAPMPFGKHKGVKMEDVPASYLHWLWSSSRSGQSKDTTTQLVLDYIERNKAALAKENEDLIWS